MKMGLLRSDGAKAAALGTITLALWYTPLSYGFATSAINSSLFENMNSTENDAVALVKTKLASFFILNASSMLVLHYNFARMLLVEKNMKAPSNNTLIGLTPGATSIIPFIHLFFASDTINNNTAYISFLCLYFFPLLTSALLIPLVKNNTNDNPYQQTIHLRFATCILATNYVFMLTAGCTLYLNRNAQKNIYEAYTTAVFLFNFVIYAFTNNLYGTLIEAAVTAKNSCCSFAWFRFPFSSKNSSSLSQAVEEQSSEGYGAIQMIDSRKGREATTDADRLDIVPTF